MIVLIIMLAAALNAVMDIVENENFSNSVFRNLNPKWWYKRESWKWAKKIGGWKFDAWHVAKSLMICLLLLPVALTANMTTYWLLDYVILGAAWNIAFNLTYKKLK